MFNENDGGGFFNADTSFGGSPQVKKGDQKRAQNIFPVTTRQVLKCPEDGLRIGGIDIYLVTIVGVVKAVETTSVKMTYTIEDDTGCIEGVHWIDGQDESGEASRPAVVENSYCRLSGTIRSQESKRYIMVFNIQQLDDLNEITSHRLEVALFSKKAENMAGLMDSVGDGMGMKMATSMQGGMANDLSSSLMVSNGNPVMGISGPQQQVLSVIQRCTNETGIHVDDILPQLKNKMSRHEITQIVDFLCGEGHIYTTIDEQHYRTTDGA